MTPESFEFTVTLPGDARLVGAVKGLSAHAAGYAQLPEPAREGFAGHVAAATEAAIAATPPASVPIDLRFTGNREAITVVISVEVKASTAPPPSTSTGDVTVEWATDGTRHVCHIRQRLIA